jgi:hypothetical protein
MTDSKHWYERWLRSKLPNPDDEETKKAKRKEYMRKWYDEHRDERLEYMHQYYANHKEKYYKPRPDHEYKECEFCGAPFYPFHLSDKYCSAMCRRRSYLKRP